MTLHKIASIGYIHKKNENKSEKTNEAEMKWGERGGRETVSKNDDIQS